MIAYYVVGLLAGAGAKISHLVSDAQLAARGAAETGTPKHGSRWNVFDLIVVAGLVVFAALRSYVGTDYSMYFRLYNSLVPNLPWQPQIDASKQELGYSALSLWARSFSSSPHLIFWLASVLTVVPTYIAIKRKSSDPGLAVLLYVFLTFYISPFNIMRQGIALAFNFLAATFLGRSKLLFVLFNVIGALFHTTAAVAAAIQLVLYRWKPGPISATVVLGGVGGVAGALFAIPEVRRWVGLISERYANYLANGNGAGVGTYLLLGVQIGLLVLAFVLASRSGNRDWLGYVVVSVAFLIVGTQLVVAARMQLYFGIFLVLLLPNQLALVAGWRKGVAVALVLASMVYFGFYLQNYGDLLPYKTYLTDGVG